MSLDIYNKKRNFKDTPEPKAKKSIGAGGLIFVVQRHDASHLHYDFRLELNGVLKSWAIPKGPSMNPNDKRLAVMVEDHPLGYADFEGDIPEGNYGAGHVDIWDNGSYEPVDEKGEPMPENSFAKGLRAGSVKFVLKGKKLKGAFALVKFKEEGNNWLLIKHRDEYASEETYSSEDFAKKSSLNYTKAKSKQTKSR